MKASSDLIEARARGVRSVGTPVWAGLTPVGVAALGPPSRPVERLMGTQRTVYRLMVWLGNLRAPRPSEPVVAALPQPDTRANAFEAGRPGAWAHTLP
jgi:hypothetical protein